jgi:hypothetical protein
MTNDVQLLDASDNQSIQITLNKILEFLNESSIISLFC